MQQTLKTYGTPHVGCYLDQSYRNPNSHNAATVRLAVSYGYEPDRETGQLLAREENDCLVESPDRSDSEMLNWCADEAIGWLNEQETRTGLYWDNNGEAGAFGLWVGDIEDIKNDVGFVSVRSLAEARRMGVETDLDDSGFPPADYRGEWLHVSDHGNCTLYVRKTRTGIFKTADGPDYIDSEIWSIV